MTGGGVVISATGLVRMRRPPAWTRSRAAIAIKPHDLDLWYNRGNVLWRLQRTEAALESYDRVLAVNPDHVRVLINRGNLLRTLGRADEAVACYQRALARPSLAGPEILPTPSSSARATPRL